MPSALSAVLRLGMQRLVNLLALGVLNAFFQFREIVAERTPTARLKRSRKDFTPSERVAIGLAVEAERKAFAAEVGRICLKLEEKSKEDGESNLDTNWILDFADKSGLSKATAHNWCAAFTKAANLSITPKQATAEVGRLILKLREKFQFGFYSNLE